MKAIRSALLIFTTFSAVLGGPAVAQPLGAGNRLGPPGGNTPPPLPAPVTPPPLPVVPVVQYFYDAGGRPGGPVSAADLQTLVKAGTLKSTTLVWTAGMPAWKPAKDVAEVAKLFPAEDASKAFLIGTWQAQSQLGIGTAETTLTYAADNTFRGAVTYSMPNSGLAGSTQVVSGTWTAAKLTEKAFTLTLTPTGQTPTTSQLTVLDNNTVRNADGTIARRIN